MTVTDDVVVLCVLVLVVSWSLVGVLLWVWCGLVSVVVWGVLVKVVRVLVGGQLQPAALLRGLVQGG